MQKTTIPETHWSRRRDHADFKQLVSRRGIRWQDCLKNPAGCKCVWAQPTQEQPHMSLTTSPLVTSLKFRISSNSNLLYILLLVERWFCSSAHSQNVISKLQKFMLKIIPYKTKPAKTQRILYTRPQLCVQYFICMCEKTLLWASQNCVMQGL